MSRSERLRLVDIRDVMRVLGEVQELGAVPLSWRAHMATGFGKLIGATVCMSVEVYGWAGHSPPRAAVLVDVGWAGVAERNLYWNFLSDPRVFMTDPSVRGVLPLAGTRFTRLREQMVDNPTWYSAPTVQEDRRRSGVDHNIQSSRPLPLPASAGRVAGRTQGGTDDLAIYRPWGAKPFGRREQRIVAFFHDELVRLWHRRATSPVVEAVESLPSQLRATFDLLMGGRSEKEVAAALGLSTHTVHGYVKNLRQRLEVSTRAELMSVYHSHAGRAPRLVGA